LKSDLGELHALLKELLSQAESEGASIEGDVKSYLEEASGKLHSLVAAVGAVLAVEQDELGQTAIGHFVENFAGQLHHAKPLEELWHSFLEEIPELVAWVEELLVEGEEIAAESSELIAAVSAEI
jgi:hypothetical protein